MRRKLKSNLNNMTRGKRIGIGYLLIIGLVIVFLLRALGVINSYRERGGLAYVQLLNFSLPILEQQVYDEGVYAENKLTLKRVVIEAIGLHNISTYSIVGNELTVFKGAKPINQENFADASSIFSFLKPYEVKEESIQKLTEEEIAQINAVSPAYNPELKKTLDKSKPEVLLYHTHTTEAYGLINSNDGSAINDTKTEDHNVLGVGDIVTKELEENYGISVIHDKTIHNASYNESYINSGQTLQSYLDQYGDFKLIVDLHRDSAPKESCTVNLNNQNLARIMYVTAQNSPRYEINRKLAENFVDNTSKLFPGLLRDANIYEYESGQHYGFNGGLSDNIILIEVGSVNNTAQEAMLTGKYVARLIAEYINSIE